jgi:hypothetical protein
MRCVRPALPVVLLFFRGCLDPQPPGSLSVACESELDPWSVVGCRGDGPVARRGFSEPSWRFAHSDPLWSSLTRTLGTDTTLPDLQLLLRLVDSRLENRVLLVPGKALLGGTPSLVCNALVCLCHIAPLGGGSPLGSFGRLRNRVKRKPPYHLTPKKS